MKYYATTDAGYVPPGWNRWVAWAPTKGSAEGGGYYNYPLSVDGKPTSTTAFGTALFAGTLSKRIVT